MASSWTELRRKETMMLTFRTPIGVSRGPARIAIRAAIVAGCALFVCACNTDQQTAGAPDVPFDYRLRHPITITETQHTLEIFVGSNRGELDASQRAALAEFAANWNHEATGGVIVDLPIGSRNQRAAAEIMPVVRSLLTAGGVPPGGIRVRGYHPTPGTLATIHLVYPKIGAQAGPCGIWPEDIGPSANRSYFENAPPWNQGCATQRNLAAMIDNPADLVQPRAETPPYEMRRTVVMDKYRNGEKTGAESPTNIDSAKLSDLGK
jgi:pilus assembly protein CpaD